MTRLDPSSLPCPPFDRVRREQILSAVLTDAPPARPDPSRFVAIGTVAAAAAAVACIAAVTTLVDGPRTTVPSPAVSSPAASAKPAEPPITLPKEPITSFRQLGDLPFARYFSGAAEEKTYFIAVEYAKKQCAAEYEFGYVPRGSQMPSGRRQFIETRYGYMPDNDNLTSHDVDTTDTFVSGPYNPTERESFVMGVDQPGPIRTDPVTGKKLPRHGCASEGFRRVDKGSKVMVTSDLMMTLDSSALTSLYADSRYLTATEKWAACVADRGYPGNPNPGKAVDVPRPVAVDCSLETGLYDVTFAVDRAYQQQLVEQHVDELEDLLRQRADVLARARAIIGESR